MIKKFSLYYHTLRYLKWTQFKYRIHYAIRSKWRSLIRFQHPIIDRPEAYEFLHLASTLPAAPHVLYEENQFTFLNQTCLFEDPINWNEDRYGKLWTYNLTYFEFLLLPTLSKREGLRLIHDFIDQIDSVRDGLEPFPTALRIMHWIKFVVQYDIKDDNIDQSLYQQIYRLRDQLEYHLLGNHLLENGFALLFGACYFQSERLYEEAKKILQPELEEQLLADGVHFELSPMYHQWMLYRVLDSYNLIKHQQIFEDELKAVLIEKAQLMLGALAQLTFSNGDIALLNDSAFDIAPSTQQLMDYAARLELEKTEVQLKECGYRRINLGRYELLIDVGNIGPSYIPGHAHSDTFSFILYVDDKPYIVDTGTSTYQANSVRQHERSTAAHNTVMINKQEQSEIWSAFRVARRAEIVHLKEGNNWIEATHNGYAPTNIYHTRRFEWTANEIIIRDQIESNQLHQATAYIHFAPNISVRVSDQNIETQMGNITFVGKLINRCQEEQYSLASRFNSVVEASQVSIDFQERLEMRIVL